jgi:D-hydroxyproline dehydrogenase subunit beta
MVGAATAYALASRGVDVELLDAGEVSGGTTGLGEGNVLCSDKDAGPELALAVLGRELFDDIERRYGELARIRRKGALVVHRDAAAFAAEPARLERLRSAGVRCVLLEPEQARALEPELAPDLLGASLFPDDLQCDPRAIARAMALEARAAGARIHTGTRVEELLPGEGVRTADAVLRADAVVLAAGPWSAPLAATAGLYLPLEPRKGQLVRLGWGAVSVRHKVFDGGYLAAVAAPEADLQISTVLETTWQGKVLVGSSRERRGFDTSVDPEVTARMLAAAKAIVPGVSALEVDSAWAGLRPWLPDGLPAIGRSATGIWVATGHEGAGVGLGPITGELLAAAISGDGSCAVCSRPLFRRLGAYGPTRHRAPSPSGSRMTSPSATWSMSAASAPAGSGVPLFGVMIAATS